MFDLIRKLFKTQVEKEPMTTEHICDHEYSTESIAIRKGNIDFGTANVVITEKCIKCGYIKRTIHADMVQTPTMIYLPLDKHLLITDRNITSYDIKLLLSTKSLLEFNWLSRHLRIHPESDTFESGIGSTKGLFKEHREYLKKHKPFPEGRRF